MHERRTEGAGSGGEREKSPECDPPLERCPACGGGPIVPFDRDVSRGNRIDRCANCTVWLVNPQYSDRWLAEFYAGYNSTSTLQPDSDVSHRKKLSVRSEGKRRALEWVGGHVEKGRVLMVGCGDGLELRIAKQQGWQPEGYDVDTATTTAIAQEHGVPVHCGEFSSLVDRTDPFDALFLDQVIEHPKAPGDHLRAAHALLRPGGVLFLATPNAGSITARWKTLAGRLGLRGKRRGRHYDSGHHLTGFSPRAMRRLFPRFGFEILGMRASLKPQRNLVAAALGRWLPILDSNFAALARRTD